MVAFVAPKSIEIIPFSKQISRDDFCSGNEILDTWLKQFAGQNESRFRARTFLAIDQDSNQLLGYYTSVFTALDADVLLAGMPVSNYKKPAFLSARLAVNRFSQNEGVGTMLLIDALRRSMQASEAAGLEVVLVDAIDSNAISFYARFGFTRYDWESNRMYISMLALHNG